MTEDSNKKDEPIKKKGGADDLIAPPKPLRSGSKSPAKMTRQISKTVTSAAKTGTTPSQAGKRTSIVPTSKTATSSKANTTPGAKRAPRNIVAENIASHTAAPKVSKRCPRNVSPKHIPIRERKPSISTHSRASSSSKTSPVSTPKVPPTARTPVRSAVRTSARNSFDSTSKTTTAHSTRGTSSRPTRRLDARTNGVVSTSRASSVTRTGRPSTPVSTLRSGSRARTPLSGRFDRHTGSRTPVDKVIGPTDSVDGSVSSRSSSPGQIYGNSNVEVFVRIRPFSEIEISDGVKNLVSVGEDSATAIIHKPESPNEVSADLNDNIKEFTFDRTILSHDSNNTSYIDQKKLYDIIGKKFLDHAFMGYNTCIFTYGQLGSGKTYTMMGNAENEGIISRLCEDLFGKANDLIDEGISVTVRVSFFEIHNEIINDLIASPPSDSTTSPTGAPAFKPSTRTTRTPAVASRSTSRTRSSVSVRGSPAKKRGVDTTGESSKFKVRESSSGPYVENISEFTVKSYSEIKQFIDAGNKLRTSSGNSHSVFIINLKQKLFDEKTGMTEEKVSKIQLIDLSGPEKITQNGTAGRRIREGPSVSNKSLTALGKVISVLSTPAANSNSLNSPTRSEKRRDLCPYRDSTLTWLMKEPLGGNYKTAMIACVSPGSYEESLSTFKYAQRAKEIRTLAVVNLDIVSSVEQDKYVLEMQKQINSLQNSLGGSNIMAAQIEKFKSAVRYYEERAIEEENKRKAILAEKQLYKDRNQVLMNEFRNAFNKHDVPNDDVLAPLSVENKFNPKPVRENNMDLYEQLDLELEAIKSETIGYRKSFKSDLGQFSAMMESFGLVN